MYQLEPFWAAGDVASLSQAAVIASHNQQRFDSGGDTGLRQSWECHRNLLGARMGNDWCHLFEVPAQQAANSTQELQIESGTRIIGFAGAHNFPKFVEAGAAMGHELRKVGTR